MSACSTQDLDLGTNLGSVEIGVLLSSVLYGVVLVQTYKYYQASFRKDSNILKIMVGCLCLMETAHSGLTWNYLYSKTIINFGNCDRVVRLHWSLRASFPLTALITVIVQTFFAHRVYVLSSSWYYPAVVLPALIVRLGFGLARGIVVSSSDRLTDFIRDFRWLILSASILGVLIDIANTVALCVLMERNYNPLLRSRKLGDKIVVWTIETGLITSIYSVIEVILILSFTNLVWIVFFHQSAKLYSNAILSFLNGRISLRSAQAASHITPASLGPRNGTTDPENIEVHIEMGVERTMERGMGDQVSGPKKMGYGDTLSSSHSVVETLDMERKASA